MTDKAVARLFDTVAPRYGDRQGGYLRIVRTGFQKGDGAEKAFIELLGAEKQLEVKRRSATRSRPRSAPSSKSNWKRARRKSRAKKPRSI